MSRIITASFVLYILMAGIVHADNPGPLSIRTGIGYDLVSQEYYLDLLYNPDSVLNSTIMTREYLDDKKGLIYMTYNPDNIGMRSIEIGWEQTSEIYRALVRGHFSTGKTNNFVADFRAEIKEQYTGEAEPGDELDVYYGKLSLRRKLTDRLNGKLSIFAEGVNFDLDYDYVYDYSRIGSRLEMTLYTGGFNLITGSTSFEKRLVPDSTGLEYLVYRGDLAYMGNLFSGMLTADGGLEIKDYNDNLIRDDYIFYILTANMKIPQFGKFFLRPELSFEYFDFRHESAISEDYGLYKFGLLAGHETGGLTLNIGPKFEYLAVKSELESDDDYAEYLISAGIDHYSYGQVFVMLENQVGKRDYLNEALYLTDFSFDRISLIGSLNIFDGLSFDLLLSAEWEWHDSETDNNRLYLISSSLTVTF